MQIEAGTIVEGKVTGLTNFGAFLSLPDNKTGMVHISEVAPTYVKEIRDYLSENQVVKVKVLEISEGGKISLSIKQCEEQAPLATKNPENKEAQQSEPKRYPRQNQRSQANVWQGPKRQSSSDDMSFEDMMARFKQVSDENLADIKRGNESKYSGGFSRRGSGR